MTSGERRAVRRYLLAWGAARRMPEPLALRAGELGGRAAYLLGGDKPRALRANLGRVLGPALSPAALDAAAGRAFALYGRYWMEAFRLQDLSAAQIRERLRVEGVEHLEKAVAAGRGVIFATPHLGNWDAGGAWLAASGYPTTAVVERLRPPELYERFARYRTSLGMRLLPLDQASDGLRRMHALLRAGEVVALVCDRTLGAGSVAVRMFGAPARMPGGAASLALRTGAALLPCAVYQGPRAGRWHAICRPPLEPCEGAGARARVAALTQRLAEEFEWLIARAPEQWHVLEPYWRPVGAAGRALLMKGAA